MFAGLVDEIQQDLSLACEADSRSPWPLGAGNQLLLEEMVVSFDSFRLLGGARGSPDGLLSGTAALGRL
jgi:hypothetical protein